LIKTLISQHGIRGRVLKSRKVNLARSWKDQPIERRSKVSFQEIINRKDIHLKLKTLDLRKKAIIQGLVCKELVKPSSHINNTK